jgi:hypothetical protein
MEIGYLFLRCGNCPHDRGTQPCRESITLFGSPQALFWSPYSRSGDTPSVRHCSLTPLHALMQGGGVPRDLAQSQPSRWGRRGDRRGRIVVEAGIPLGYNTLVAMPFRPAQGRRVAEVIGNWR